MLHKIRYFILAVPLLCLFSILFYELPPVHDRLAWRVDNIRSEIQYVFNPPEKVVFVPQEKVDAVVKSTLLAMTPTATQTHTPSPTVPGSTTTPIPSVTPTLTPTPLPDKVRLSGIVHDFQRWNNCGPTTLAMALSFWGWKGTQTDTAAFLKPNPRDKNVMPYEMLSFIQEKTDLKAVVRVGGDEDLLKRFIAAGFPVVVEKGFEVPKEGWMGHYEVLNGYDDAKKVFLAQDSYTMPDKLPDLPVQYDQLNQFWRHFDYIYLVIYPPEREAEVFAILGPQVDETYNFQYAAQKASEDIYSTTGREQYFAWFNRGTNLVKLQDYGGGAAAYDQAFGLYTQIPEKERPWRMLWYQTGPYFAYFYTGRYSDVINLATNTITVASEPAIEESFYWRGMARAATGDTAGAIADYKESLKWHKDFEPALQQLDALGVGE